MNNKSDDKEIDQDDIKVEVEKSGKFDYLRNNSGQSDNNARVSGLEVSNPVDRTDNDINTNPPKFKVPPALWRTFVCSLSLFVLGSVLIGIGFIDSVADADPGKGVTFWTIGSIVLIPGGYYSYQFWRAKRSRDEDERAEIYNEIPEL
jgi:hypothetical protein